MKPFGYSTKNLYSRSILNLISQLTFDTKNIRLTNTWLRPYHETNINVLIAQTNTKFSVIYNRTLIASLLWSHAVTDTIKQNKI